MTAYRGDLMRWQPLPVALCHPRSLALGLQAPNPDALAACAAADPGLCMHLLEHAAALPASPAAQDVAGLLQQLGPERCASLLRALYLRQHDAPVDAPPRAARARLRARLALAIASQAQYPASGSAYLCALLLDAGEWLGQSGTAAAELTQALFTRWRLPVAAQDALRYRSAAWEALRGLHPLTQILRIASACVEQPQEAARDPALQALLQDTQKAEAAETNNLAAEPLARAHLHLQASLPSPLRSGQELCLRLSAALHAWFSPLPLLVLRYDATRHRLAALNESAAGLHLDCAATASSPVRAWLSGEPCTYGPATAAGSLADEQLARLLGRDNLLCLPLRAAAPQGVLVLAARSSEWPELMQRQAELESYAQAAAQALAALTPAPVSESTATTPALPLREILHEAAAPLTTLRNYLHVLQARAPGAELRVMAEEIERLDGILQQLRGAGRSTAPGAVDVNRLLRDVVDSLGLSHPGRQLCLDLDTALKPLLLDGGALKQVLINLVQNALEAMPAGGRLSARSQGGVYVDGAESLLIEVRDNGPGVPAAQLRQLFEPKTSSKAGHSGLGLSIAARLVRELGGSLSYHGGAAGACFQIFLPRSSPEPDHVPA